MKVFRKTGVSTLINILGMSVAFAAAMILMVQVRWDTTYDANFEGHKQVFRMENNWMDEGQFDTYFSRPMIELVKKASPNIEAIGTQYHSGDAIFYREDDKELAITVPFAMADSAMFTVFPFEWTEGSARDFIGPGTAVLNEAIAKMFFGEESAIGKTLQTSDGNKIRIIGVFKNTPRNYSMHYGLIGNLGDWNLTEGSEWSYPAFVKLKDPTAAAETVDAMLSVFQEYFSNYSPDELAKLRKGFRISQLHKAHFERDVRAHNAGANRAVTITLALVAILLILISIINFINFAFAEIPFRIKSINTRKVLGEGRGSLIGRQLLHAGLIALIAFAIACLIMHVVAGPS